MSEPGQTVLLIEDNPGDARLLREMLAEEPAAPFRLHCVDRLARGLDFLSAEEPALVLLDLSLPDSMGLETFERVFAHAPRIPIIVLTGNDDQGLALAAVKSGAQDYLVKGRLDRELLQRSMQYSIERKRYQEQLERQANYDRLTNLPNRQLFRDRLARAMANTRRNGRMLAVMFLDLDRFKEVNDTLGHEVGDVVLKAVANALIKCMREGDTIARMGGDEFTIILEDLAHVEQIRSVAHKILGAFAAPIRYQDQELFLSASIGIATYLQPGVDIDSLLKHADLAMYRAKEEGATFQFYDASMSAATIERVTLETSLRHALNRDEFILHYQPIVDARHGRLTGVEALLRWQHPEHGLIGPGRFIQLAEQTGLIVPIGEWVLQTACMQCAAWQREGRRPLQVAVNLSPRQFRKADLMDTVVRALEMSGLPPDLLQLEITEGLLMDNPQASRKVLERLKDMGVRVSVDDFGTGYSSLSYLKQFPLDILKIDQSFVRDIGTDPDDAAIVEAITVLARSLGLRLTAEGVETEEQRTFLRTRACDTLQGYLFSHPLPATEVTGLLQGEWSWMAAPTES